MWRELAAFELIKSSLIRRRPQVGDPAALVKPMLQGQLLISWLWRVEVGFRGPWFKLFRALEWNVLATAARRTLGVVVIGERISVAIQEL